MRGDLNPKHPVNLNSRGNYRDPDLSTDLSDSSAYAASFGVSATSSNTAWTVVSVIPSQVPSSGKSDSISQTITVKITAPATTGSTTTLTVKAVNQQDGSADCSTGTRLTTVAFQPPPTVPQFPLGFALLMAVAIPVMFVAKSKYAARATR